MIEHEAAVDVTQHLANETAQEIRHPGVRQQANNRKIEKPRYDQGTGS